MNAADVDLLIQRHLREASGTLRDCAVNELSRGESTRRNYFIFKIDLTGSTEALRSVRPATYGRVSHVYLSTVDRITQEYGAEAEQTEYHGDGVLALFPERGNVAAAVLRAAILSHYAVRKLRHEAGIAGLQPKVLLHFAPLVVAKIGPYSESHRVAIGMPIHFLSKQEKEIRAPQIWVSDDFARQMQLGDRNGMLTRRTVPRTETKMVPEEPPPAYGSLASLAALINPRPQTTEQRLADLLFKYPPTNTLLSAAAPAAPRMVPETVTMNDTDGYNVKLAAAYNVMRIPLAMLADG